MKKPLKQIVGVIVPVVIISALAHVGMAFVFGRALTDTYSTVSVPSYRYVSYDEIRRCPPDIAWEYYYWFNECLDEDTLIELRRYMRENDLYISPGDYMLARVRNFEDLKSRLKFTAADDIPENAYEQYLAWSKIYY